MYSKNRMSTHQNQNSNETMKVNSQEKNNVIEIAWTSKP